MATPQVPVATVNPTAVLEKMRSSPANTEMKISPQGASNKTGERFGGGSMKSIPNDMEGLKKEAPEMYNKMMEGLAWNICGKMKDHQDRLVEIMREEKRRNGG